MTENKVCKRNFGLIKQTLSKHDKVYGEKIVRRISFVRKSEIDVKDGEQFLIELNIKRLSPNCGEV